MDCQNRDKIWISETDFKYVFDFTYIAIIRKIRNTSPKYTYIISNISPSTLIIKNGIAINIEIAIKPINEFHKSCFFSARRVVSISFFPNNVSKVSIHSNTFFTNGIRILFPINLN